MHAGVRDNPANHLSLNIHPIPPHPRQPSRGGCFVAITSGANMDFNRLRFVSDRAMIGEGREANLSVAIPETPGSFEQLYGHVYPRAVTEFSYRYR